MLKELARMHVVEVVLSTNMELRQDGLPRSGQKQPLDPGVAVYFRRFKLDRSLNFVLACDRWRCVEDNLYALAKHIEALRGQERWGVGTLDQAFAGYAQLPPATTTKHPWRVVLGLDDSFTRLPKGVQLDVMEAAFKKLTLIRHPDAGGSAEWMAELINAREEARRELKGTDP